MAVRRPRIKATALLITKRKPRDVKTDSSEKTIGDEVQSPQLANSLQNDVNKVLKGEPSYVSENPVLILSEEISEPSKDASTHDLSHQEDTRVSSETSKESETLCGHHQPTTSGKDAESTNYSDNKHDINKTKADNSFKYPARIEYTRSNSQNASNIGVDDVFYTDMEDMQKNGGDYPTTSLKQQTRQRIRPVPLFQRRNSLIGVASPALGQSEDNPTSDIQSQQSTQTSETDTLESASPVPKTHPVTHRRERHYSASMAQCSLTPIASTGGHHYTPHKFTPAMGLGRIRTESNCSAHSDSFVTPSKVRKTDEQHSNRSNHLRDFAHRKVNGNLDKSSLKMFDLIYYNPATNPMEKRTEMPSFKKESAVDENETNIVPSSTTNPKEEMTDGTSNAMPVPQLKLNANGDLILDEKTLEIETTAEQEARKVLANSSLIFLDENTGMNGFYKRQKRTKEWPGEETIKFYRCLQTVGTDFSLMCQLFPKRTRRDLKLKFKKEERSNLALINKALLYPKLFNIDDLKTQLETEERERKEELQRWKEIHQKEAENIKKVKINGSAAARSLKNGEDIYENENVITRKLSSRAKANPKKKSDKTKKSIATATEPPHSYDNDNLVVQQPASENICLKENASSGGTVVKHNRNTSIILPTDPTKSPVKSRKHINAPKQAVAPMTSSTTTPVKLEVVQVTDYNVKTEHSNVYNNWLNSQTPTCENDANSLEIAKRLVHVEEGYINYTTHENSGTLYQISEIITPNHEMAPLKSDHALTEFEQKTIVDLDDGTVNTLEGDDDDAMMDAMPATPASLSQREVDECDIQQILMDLAAGSLVLVSTLDIDNADQVINEIYMIDKITGELCDKPLDIPESIVQGVLSVMS